MIDDVLPEGWLTVKIEDVSLKAEQRKPDDNEEIIYVDIGSIDREAKKIIEPQKLLGNKAPSRARKVINTGDVLVSLTRPNLNAVAQIGEEFDRQIASTGFEVIKPLIVESEYIFSLVKSKDFVNAISGKVQGALYPAAKSSDVRSYAFPLPPLAEQKQIATKLDQLLSQVNTLKNRLDKIPTILKRFRQSVLAAAVSGKLTTNWKERNKSDEWVALKLEDIISDPKSGLRRGPFGSAIKKQFFVPSGYKVYEQKNAIYDDPNLGGYYIDNEKFKELEKFSIEKGDFIVSCAGTIGKICLLPQGCKEGVINQALMRLRVDRDKVNEKYFLLFFKSPVFQQKILSTARGGAMQNMASVKEIKATPIFLPSLDEQNEIVSCVGQLFNFADQIEKQINSAQTRVNNLTQSILAKAFRGELTAEWREENPDLISSENSAESLLEKIKAERESIKPTKKVRRKMTA